MSSEDYTGILLVISSPSGGGKTSIYRALLESGPPYEFSVSVTTRPPRGGEEDGVHYRFIGDEEFERLVEEDSLAEWAEVHGHRYGTRKEYVERALDSGRVMIFEIDVQGARQLREAYPEHVVSVFIVPPSPQELERRLRERGTDDDDEIELRLKNARDEIKSYNEFDYLVYNDILKDAVADVKSIVRAELQKTKRRTGDIWPETSKRGGKNDQ